MKRAFLAATAVLAVSINPIVVTPAFANPPPIADTTGLTPEQVCELQLNPSVNSGFTTYPEGESVGPWVDDGPPYADDPIGDPEGYGTPTYSNVFLSNSYFRNGGSPNVWAIGQATITYPQTRQLFSFVVDQTRTTTFDCVVEKEVGNNNTIEPAGLQSFGNSSVEHNPGVPAGEDYVITNVPFVITGAEVTALICISPNNVTKGKPGTWTGKHGFNAAGCPAASIAAGGTVPSGNAPDLP